VVVANVRYGTCSNLSWRVCRIHWPNGRLSDMMGDVYSTTDEMGLKECALAEVHVTSAAKLDTPEICISIYTSLQRTHQRNGIKTNIRTGAQSPQHSHPPPPTP